MTTVLRHKARVCACACVRARAGVRVHVRVCVRLYACVFSFCVCVIYRLGRRRRAAFFAAFSGSDAGRR